MNYLAAEPIGQPFYQPGRHPYSASLTKSLPMNEKIRFDSTLLMIESLLANQSVLKRKREYFQVPPV